jgi:hypothetical protein
MVAYPKEGDLVCEPYVDWIRSLVCFFCGAPPRSDAHHVRAKGSGVCDDLTCIPACRRDHDRCDGQRVDGLAPIGKDEQNDAVDYYLAKAMREAPPAVLRAVADARERRVQQVVF